MSQSLRVAKNNVTHLSGTAFGTLDITRPNISITTTGAATATLPSGTLGQEVFITLIVDGGDLVLTGDFTGANVSATFADAGDSLKLIWTGLEWEVLVNVGTVVLA